VFLVFTSRFSVVLALPSYDEWWSGFWGTTYCLEVNYDSVSVLLRVVSGGGQVGEGSS